MKLSSIKRFVLLLGVLVFVFVNVSSTSANDPGKEPSPDETLPDVKLKAFTMVDWLRSLEKEKRTLVVSILEQNMACIENGESGSTPRGQNWKESVYNDLQAVLTPGEFGVFTGLLNSNSPAARAAGTSPACEDCYDGVYYLNLARWYINSSVQHYDASYCNFGSGDDVVYINLTLAHTKAEDAYQRVLSAYNYCSCSGAGKGLAVAQSAKSYLNAASGNTAIYCGSGTPWEYAMNRGFYYLYYAILRLDDCVDQACN